MYIKHIFKKSRTFVYEFYDSNFIFKHEFFTPAKRILKNSYEYMITSYDDHFPCLVLEWHFIGSTADFSN